MVLKKSTARLKLPETTAGTLSDLVSAAADLTVVLDRDDIIDDLSHHLGDLSSSPISAWRGRAIEDVVLGSSRTRLRTMLNAARAGKSARGFDIAHPLDDGRELPVQYSAFRVGSDGQMVLVGRDLRPVADLQSRLVANRHSLEQNQKRQQQSEAHYRLLFETASDAIVIVDGRSGRIREVNPRAAAIFETAGQDLGSRKLSSVFDRSHQAEIQAMLSHVMTTGTPTTLATVATGRGRALSLAAELFRAGDLKLVLLRIATPGDAIEENAADAGLGDLVRNAAEAVLVTDEDGTALWANGSLLALAGIALAAQAVGKRLDEFFRWHGIEEDVLLANVRRHGRVPTVSGTLRGANGQMTEVELSAIARSEGARAGYAFVMRARSQEPSAPGRAGDPLARTVENLTELVGRVPMRDMVRDTTDVIERMCIEAALKLTGNNRASAARVLGLSRQALYLKMNRFGIADGE